MTTIAVDNDVVTLFNVFSVEPANQQAVIDVLVEATQAVMNRLPGFVSANIHRSLDGVKVVNYAQCVGPATLRPCSGVRRRKRTCEPPLIWPSPSSRTCTRLSLPTMHSGSRHPKVLEPSEPQSGDQTASVL